jgi:hypothetical protein
LTHTTPYFRRCTSLKTDGSTHTSRRDIKAKAKWIFTIYVKTTKETEEKVTLKGTGGMIKMNRRAFVSINLMREGHSSLKASLSRFNIVSTAQCVRGDELQTEEHIFWDCKLYEGQRATMMDILFENRKQEYSKSVADLLRLEEIKFMQGVLYFTNKIPKFIKKIKKCLYKILIVYSSS